jgi:hypothetical protein
MSEPLNRLARRFEADPRFLACFLAEYAQSEGLVEGELARELGCTGEALTGIRLCRAPRSDAAGFREDVRQVAEQFGLDAVRLAEIIRQGEAFRLLRAGAVGAAGFLMAARDRPEVSDSGPEEKAT